MAEIQTRDFLDTDDFIGRRGEPSTYYIPQLPAVCTGGLGTCNMYDPGKKQTRGAT